MRKGGKKFDEHRERHGGAGERRGRKGGVDFYVLLSRASGSFQATPRNSSLTSKGISDGSCRELPARPVTARDTSLPLSSRDISRSAETCHVH